MSAADESVPQTFPRLSRRSAGNEGKTGVSSGTPQKQKGCRREGCGIRGRSGGHLCWPVGSRSGSCAKASGVQ